MSEWKTYKMFEIGQVVGGATPSTKNPLNYDGDIAWLTPKDLSSFSDRYIERGERDITEEGYNSCSTKMLPQNTVLFSSRAPIGYIAIAKNELCTNQGFKSVIPGPRIDYMFLYYLLKYKKNDIENMGSGTTFKEVSGNVMKNIEVSIPDSIDEQKKIAGVLDRIDSKIEINNAINRNLSEQASAFYEAWKLGLEGETKELSKVIDVRDGTHDSPKQQEEGYPLVTSKHLLEYDVDLKSPNRISKEDYDKTNERSKVNYHDVLMSMIGTVGLVSFVTRKEINFAIKNVALFRTSDNEELAYYFLLFLKSKDTKSFIESCLAGSTQQYISLTELRKIPIIVPSCEKISEFNSVVKPLIDTICMNVRENQSLAELRDSLLPKLMSGEIDVSEINI